MKLSTSRSIPVVETDEWEAADLDDLKEVAHLDDPTGDLAMKSCIHQVFRCAGYRVRQVAKDAVHPVWIVHLVRNTARPIKEKTQLFQHMHQLLKNAALKLRKSELTVQRTGDRILIAFPSGDPAADFEQILREPQEDMVDYADVVL